MNLLPSVQKYYIPSLGNMGIYQEGCTTRIYEDLRKVLEPKRLRVTKGLQHPLQLEKHKRSRGVVALHCLFTDFSSLPSI